MEKKEIEGRERLNADWGKTREGQRLGGLGTRIFLSLPSFLKFFFFFLFHCN